MKLLTLMLTLFSLNSFAVETFTCPYNEYILKVTLNHKEDAGVMVFLKNKKISSCQLEVISYEDDQNNASEFELTRFKRKNCNIIYDRVSKKIKIINSGYFKRKSKGDILSAYVVENVSPLHCKKVP